MANKIETLISEEKLAARVAELGKQIEKDYQGKDLVCVGLLKGSVVFMTENKIETLISEEKLAARVAELGKQIEKDYQGKDLVCVGLLKGSVVFMTDLIKTINLDLKIDFMKVSSYGNGTDSTGIVKILKDVDEEVTGKDVLLIEDIVDTGLTLANVKEFMWKKKPNSIKICTLLE